MLVQDRDEPNALASLAGTYGSSKSKDIDLDAAPPKPPQRFLDRIGYESSGRGFLGRTC